MSTQVTLRGRVGKDPEIRYSPKGTAVASFSVVTTQRYKDAASGEWMERNTTWWNCVAFGQLGENCAESLAKGMNVIVNGTAYEDAWTDKDGNQRKTIKVTCEDVAPSLRWASAKVTKAQRASANLPREAGPEDSAWQRPAPAGGSSSAWDEPPF